MKQFLFLILMFLLSSLLAQSNEYVFPRIESQINLPLSIPVKDVNDLVNASVTGVLYEDNSFTDNNNDQFKVRVIKNGEIKIKALKNNRLLISVPLNIWTEQGYGGFGQYMYKDISFGVVMQFITDVDFKTNWTLSTQTKAYGFEWTSKPTLDFGSVSIPITSLVESRLTEQQSQFTKIIDDKIKESIDLKSYLVLIWNQFNQPINVSEDYNTWLKITPKSIFMTPLVIYSDYIQASIGLELYSETFIGRVPNPNPKVNTVPNFQLVSKIVPDFNLQTTANITFEDATRIAQKQFVGQEFVLTSESNKVKVIDMKVYADKQAVVLEIQTEGEINGTSIIKGFPYYDQEKQRIALRNIDFSLKTGNIFKKAIALLFEGKIKRMIAQDYGIPMGEMIDLTKKNLLMNFNKEYYPGIFLKGKVNSLQPSQIILFDRFISVVIDTHANLRIDVNGFQIQ